MMRLYGSVLVVLGAAGNLGAAEPSCEDRPYNVSVKIGFEAIPEFDAAFRTAVCDQTLAGIERFVGPLWRATVVEEPGDLFSGAAAIIRLAPERLAARPAALACDKVFLLAVAPAGAGLRVTGREWDSATRQLGPPAAQVLLDRRELATTVLSLLHELFRPIAEIDHARSGRTTLRALAGNLAPADSSWQVLPAGKLFEVYNLTLNAELEVERIQQVPWTYLSAGDDAGAGRVECTVTSGLRAPLSTRRHRLKPLALAVNDRGAATKLTLVTRAPAQRPLAGVEVELSAAPHPGAQADRSEPAEDAKKLPVLITDRNGVVSLKSADALADRPVWLFVRSGQVLLARVPYLPGLRVAESLELPDDSLRLDVEGDIALLQARLVDTVARRAMLMSQAKARAKANQFDTVGDLIGELDAMPKAGRFVEDLNLIRINRTKAARARRDKSTEERIKKLCTETEELVRAYLDEDKLTEVRDEVRELRRAVDDQAAMEAKGREAEARAAARAAQGLPADPKQPGDSEPAPAKKKKKASQPADAGTQPATPAPKPVGF
ncbi:MAG: hypothetical protein HY290_30990 [Planctomycetia bacterium]|nr:hypothetical protein [Planctomycetia bacterium]